MSKMITVTSGFQYSVNIGYDLNSDDKLKNFIPTKSALELMEDVLLSTNPTSNERARVLVWKRKVPYSINDFSNVDEEGIRII